MKPLTVIDVFCGGGGFSEGFRQQGFEIELGIDRWQPAIDTFNHNFRLDCKARNVLEFLESVDAIEGLPDTDVILGSPPCVSFSSSNISGKADKSVGITLTQTFLRIVAVKKWKKGSKLQAWLMENVPRSVKHLASEYTFEDLGLGDWAIENKIGPSKVAIRLSGNHEIVNSADYGSAQARKRVISGELIARKSLVVPEPTHSETASNGKKIWRTLVEIKNGLPDPSSSRKRFETTDPNYTNLKLFSDELTDHFYDTGLYECEWNLSRYWKTNHPFMGKMSFPENEDKPSRTVTATKIGSSREALIYKSALAREGNGEYRTPTVREAACLMGFPITYQFKGSEGTKWRLVGNAVCPSVSRAFAAQILIELGEESPAKPLLSEAVNTENVCNLNTFTEKIFNNPPKKNKGSRFRRHPFKDGNMTVTLSNYDIAEKTLTMGHWLTSVQYGTGNGFPNHVCSDDTYLRLEPQIARFEKGFEFLTLINNGFLEKIGNSNQLQILHELQNANGALLNPSQLVDEVGRIIDELDLDNQI
ncbi:MAG TPA: DNA cytosine methyltransferase, partial [Pyrinomonadaceae bacterium]|nr:DNA cytosine methyltransferase [Pyrinomonadaceae bacterium]